MNIFEIILALIGVALIIFAFMLKTKKCSKYNAFQYISFYKWLLLYIFCNINQWDYKNK